MKKSYHITLFRFNIYHVLIALVVILAAYLIGRHQGAPIPAEQRQFITLPTQEIIPEEDTIHIVIPVDMGT